MALTLASLQTHYKSSRSHLQKQRLILQMTTRNVGAYKWGPASTPSYEHVGLGRPSRDVRPSIEGSHVGFSTRLGIWQTVEDVRMLVIQQNLGQACCLQIALLQHLMIELPNKLWLMAVTPTVFRTDTMMSVRLTLILQSKLAVQLRW